MTPKANYDIINECSVYLNEYTGPPFIKWIPNEITVDNPIIKIKLRYKKNSTTFDDLFNEALSTKNLRQRSLFLKNSPIKDHSPFFIFPPNGYKTLYNTMVNESIDLKEQLFEPLLQLKCTNTIRSLFKEVLELYYKSDDPTEALSQNKEVILYDIPYVYGIKKGNIDFNTVKKIIFEEQSL